MQPASSTGPIDSAVQQLEGLADAICEAWRASGRAHADRAPELVAALRVALADGSGAALYQAAREISPEQWREVLRSGRGAALAALVPATRPEQGAALAESVADVFADALVRGVEARCAEQERELKIFKGLVDNALDGIGVASLDGVMHYANPAYQAMSGFGEQTIGSTILEYFNAERADDFAREILPALIQHDRWQGLMHLERPDGSRWISQTSAFLLTDDAGNPAGISAIFRDVTAEHNAAQERAALQEQVIQAQQAVLRELSTPLIPLSDQVLLMPLIGSIDTARAQQVIETLLESLARDRATIAILDISGVRVVDTQVAGALLRAAQAVRLLGAQAIITGIRPEIAQTLVSLGLDLSGVVTCATLQRGVALALGAAL